MNMAERASTDGHALDLEAVKRNLEQVLPRIEAGSELAEAQRKPVDEVIAALAETGIFRAFVPADTGGSKSISITLLIWGSRSVSAAPRPVG